MSISFDPKIVRKGQKTHTQLGKEFASLDNPKPSPQAAVAAKTDKRPDPAQAAFSTNCAFLSRITG